MKTYKGLVDIDCGKGQRPCPYKYQKNVQADCLNCELAKVRIVDLDRKPLAVLKPSQSEAETDKPKPAPAPEKKLAVDKSKTKEG